MFRFEIDLLAHGESERFADKVDPEADFDHVIHSGPGNCD